MRQTVLYVAARGCVVGINCAADCRRGYACAAPPRRSVLIAGAARRRGPLLQPLAVAGAAAAAAAAAAVALPAAGAAPPRAVPARPGQLVVPVDADRTPVGGQRVRVAAERL